MPAAPDYANLIPVKFQEGEALTAQTLNELQARLLQRILEHTHGGNDQATPQGKPIKRDGIDREEILGNHIHDRAITARHFEAGAVDGDALGEGQVAARHLAGGAVGTDALENGAVNRDKLAPEVAALLDNLRGSASTFGYFAFIDGNITYPHTTGNWYDWMLDKETPVVTPVTDIFRINDTGNWQPTRYAGMGTDFKPPIAFDFGVRSNRPHHGKRRGGRAAKAYYASQVTVDFAAATSNATLAKTGLVGDYYLAGFGELPAELLERKQIKVDLNTANYPGLLPHSGTVTLNPGVGGTEAFRENRKATNFLVEISKTTQVHWDVARRIAYSLGIDVDDHEQLSETGVPDNAEKLLQRLYEVLQYPERVLAGYWTGPTQNVRSVIRLKEDDLALVRLTFNVPYSSPAYAVQVTADYSGKAGLLMPTVVHRHRKYVDLAFWNGSAYTNRAHFSLSVVGELSAT